MDRIKSVLRRIFGRQPPRPPREILADAVAEIGDPSLVPRALALFDDPRPLIDQWHEEQGERPSWADPARPRSAAELAYQVFELVLREDGRIGYLDWADGWMCVEREFNKMFARAGVPAVNADERAYMTSATENCERGQTTQILWDFLYELGTRRDLQLDWIRTDADCHFPIFMKPAAYRKWRYARFGKGVDVLP